MAEAQGRVRISLSFDTADADRGVKSVAESFRRLGESAKRALSGTSMDSVKNSAKSTADAIHGIRDGMDDMTTAEAKAAAALAKQLAVVDGLVAQINNADGKTNAALASLAAQQQTLEDNIRRTAAAASELQTKWEQIDQSVKRDRTTGDILPGQDDKIAQLDKLGGQMADLDAKTRSYQARLDALKAKIQSVNESHFGADGTHSVLESKLAAAEAQAAALRQKLDEVRQAQGTALGGDSGKMGGVMSSIGGALGGGLKRAGMTAQNVFGAIPGYAKRSFAKISRMGAPVTKLFERIGRSARQVFVIGAILSILRGARDTLSDIVSQDGKIASQLSTIKGNLRAAFAPLWEVVYPAVTAILNGLIAITSAIANLSAKLFGSATGATSALYAEAGAIGAVGAAAGEAKNELGAFDEINKLDDKSGGGGSGGSGGLITDLSWSFSDLYDRLMAINWESIAARINDTLMGIDFEGIGAALNRGIVYVENTLSTLLRGIDWEQLGGNIARGMNNLFAGDALPNLAGLLADWFNARIDLFFGFVSTFDWVGLGNSIAMSLNRFTKTIQWGKAGKAISELAKGILRGIRTALENTDWESVGDSIAEFIKAIDWAEVCDLLTDIISAGLQGIGTIALDVLTEITGIDLETDSDTLKTLVGGAIALLMGGTFSSGGVGLGKFAVAAGLLIAFTVESAHAKAKELTDEWWEPDDGYSGNVAQVAAGKMDEYTYYSKLTGLESSEQAYADAETVFSTVQRLDKYFVNGVKDVDSYRNSLMDLGLTAEQADARIEELTNSNSSLAVQFANGKISAEEYEAGLIALGMTAATADKYVEALNNGFNDIDSLLQDGTIGLDKYIELFGLLGGRTDEAVTHLIELGYNVEEIEAAMSGTAAASTEAADNVERMGTAAEDASETTGDLSDSMNSAAESAQDMADSTETVADNSADAEKAVKSEAKTLSKAEGDMDDAAEASADLGEAAEDMAEATSDGIITMDEALQNNLSGWQSYAAQLAGIMAGITAKQTAFWADFAGGAASATGSIKAAFTQLGSHMSATMSTAWKNVIAAMSGGGTSFSAITDGIGRVIKSSLNGMITGLNSVFRQTFGQLNNVLAQLRSTRVNGMLPFGAIRSISIPTIPKLARGAVIPANHEFLAVLGDQKHGTNVEAPLDVITDAMAIALQRSDTTGERGISAEAIAAAVKAALSGMTVQIDREQVGRVVAGAIDDNRRADGKFAYDLA